MGLSGDRRQGELRDGSRIEDGEVLSQSGDSRFAAREAALDRINDDPAWAQRAYGASPRAPRRKSHGRYGRGDDHVPCALCNGDGEVCNPLNSDPATKVTDWHRPVACPRCGATGKDPNP